MALTGQPYFNSIDDPKTDASTMAAPPAARQVVGPRGRDRDRGQALGRDLGDDPSRRQQLPLRRSPLPRGGRGPDRRRDLAGRALLARLPPRLRGRADRPRQPTRGRGAARRATARFAAGEIELSILLCDVDKLKATNDARGHAAGDEALRRVGAALTASAADYPGSFVGRIGGDEFCVLLETRIEDAVGSDYPRIADLAGAAQRLLTVDGRRAIPPGPRSRAAWHRRRRRRQRRRRCSTRPTPLSTWRSAAAATGSARRPRRPRTGALAPIPGGGSRERFWETCEEIIRTLDGELRDAGTLDRLEVVATAFTAAGDFARWAIAYAADGKGYLRDCSLGDNRERRRDRSAGRAQRDPLRALRPRPLPRHPGHRRGRKRFVHHQGRRSRRRPFRAGAPRPRGFLRRDRRDFRRRIGRLSGRARRRLADAPLEEVDAPLRLAIRAAISPHRHRRDAEPLSRRHSRALELSLALADRLRERQRAGGLPRRRRGARSGRSAARSSRSSASTATTSSCSQVAGRSRTRRSGRRRPTPG